MSESGGQTVERGGERSRVFREADRSWRRERERNWLVSPCTKHFLTTKMLESLASARRHMPTCEVCKVATNRHSLAHTEHFARRAQPPMPCCAPMRVEKHPLPHQPARKAQAV